MAKPSSPEPPAENDEPLGGSVVTLGNFDGVHLGHRAIVGAVTERSRKLGVPAVVLTLHPHPIRVLRPDKAFKLIMPLEERIERLKALGIDRVTVLRFDHALAALGAREFLEHHVLVPLRPRVFVAGPDTRFGRDRAGDAELLRVVGKDRGFEVVQVPKVLVGGQRIGSSGLRRLVAAGDMSTVKTWLGRPFTVLGRVVHGEGRGRGIGVPTANVHTDNDLLPALGVYAVQLRLAGEQQSRPGVANLGLRPTFDTPTPHPVLEVHLLSPPESDLYGAEVEVAFLEMLRGERRFDSVEALVSQIHADIEAARGKLPA